MENFKKINQLLAKHTDMHKVYIDSLSIVKDASLYALLKKLADKRRIYSLELTAVISSLYPNTTIDVEGTFAGALSRGWLDLKASIALEDDKTILRHSLDSEESIKDEYDTFLAEENDSQKIKEVLTVHVDTITKSIKDLYTVQELL